MQPLVRESLCTIGRIRSEQGSPSLGLFRPRTIERLAITPSDPSWTDRQQNILNQQLLGFFRNPPHPLEKIPYDFRYEFHCSNVECKGHKLICIDWEIGQSYRAWRNQYGDSWEEKFRERYECDIIEKFDTHFYVGTLHQHPKSWIIMGLFYPPKPPMNDLFQ